MNQSKSIFFRSLKFALPYWLLIFRTRFFYILGIYIVTLFCSFIAHYISNTHSILALLVPLSIHCFCFALIGWNALFVIPYFVQKKINQEGDRYFCKIPSTFFSFLKSNLYTWLKEMGKVMTLSYLWSFCLLIPGVIKFIRCTFVSYIALFDDPKNKKHSSLKISAKMTKGLMRWLILLTIMSVVLSSSLGYITKIFDVDQLSMSVLLVKGIEYGWSIACYFFLSIAYHLMYLEKETNHHILPSQPEEVYPVAYL